MRINRFKKIYQKITDPSILLLKSHLKRAEAPQPAARRHAVSDKGGGQLLWS